MAPLFNSNTERNLIRRTPSQASHPRSIASGSTQRTDVFSDEFALEPIDTGEMSPVDSVRATANSTWSARNSLNRLQNTPIPPATIPTDDEDTPTTSPIAERSAFTPSGSYHSRSSILAQQPDADPRRSLSVSSEFTMDRSPSPYNGPTAPTQPYAMYPQVTRASSVTSASTVRPIERPFIPQGGPEHPYGMYQNTVPEEEDDDNDHTNSIPPVTFGATPALASSLAGGSSSSGNDTGDIVGSDGHVEQLPPYTRYADNVVAKGDMADINGDVPTHEYPSPSVTDASVFTPNQSSSETEINPTSSATEERALAKKEGLYERSKRRKCCGIPLIILVLLILVIIISATIGGVIGGIVGNRKGVDHANAAAASTTTLWLDADPVQTGPSTPHCPTGHFGIVFENIGNIDQCVNNPALMETWDCLDKAGLGITVMEEGPRGSGDISIQFDDYSNLPQLFKYGPQPPDFNGTKFDLNPVEDRDNRDYGVAMFFSYLFDKIVILPEEDLHPQHFGKRDGSNPRISRRASYGDVLRPGDNPWYCYWNQTVEEFWVFLEQEVTSFQSSENVSAAAAMAVSPTISGYPKPASLSSLQTSSTSSTTSPTVAPQAFYEKPVYPHPTPADWGGPKYREKRDASSTSNSGSKPIFPKMIKMVEKRKPFGNIEPYCQQMVVGDNFAIYPKPQGAIVNINEEEFQDLPPYASPTGGSKRSLPGSKGTSLVRRDEHETVTDLESLCICEWRYP